MKTLITLGTFLVSTTSHAALGWFLLGGMMLGSNSTSTTHISDLRTSPMMIVVPTNASTCRGYRESEPDTKTAVPINRVISIMSNIEYKDKKKIECTVIVSAGVTGSIHTYVTMRFEDFMEKYAKPMEGEVARDKDIQKRK